MDKKIVLKFCLEQVCNDVLAKCNLISLSLTDAALADIRTNVQEPDNAETRSIVCRAVSEAFGRVKAACQRYMSVGRTSDNNNLERLVSSVTDDKVTYESVTITLNIPNFNTSVTDLLKSSIHKYVVDYVMWRFLQDQVADKASEYKTIADEEDFPSIIQSLNSRERYTMRKPGFI